MIDAGPVEPKPVPTRNAGPCLGSHRRSMMVMLDASIVTIALPSAQRALHISVANRQWVITATPWPSADYCSSGVVSLTSGAGGGCSSSD